MGDETTTYDPEKWTPVFGQDEAKLTYEHEPRRDPRPYSLSRRDDAGD